MAEIKSLRAQRARKSGDAKEITVKDCLEAALEDCEEKGWDKCLLVFSRPDGDGTFAVDRRSAGVSTLEARGLMLTEIKDEILD